MSKYKFGDIVTVDGQMGVTVQTWGTDNYEVYVKNRGLRTCKRKDISIPFSRRIPQARYRRRP